MWKYFVSGLGIVLFAFAFVPFFRTLSARQIAWLAFASLIAATPWLPIQEFAVGDTSVKLFERDAAKASGATLTELRQLAAANKAQFEKQQAEINALNQSSRASSVQSDQKIQKLAASVNRAERQYQEARRQSAAAQAQLQATAKSRVHGYSLDTYEELRGPDWSLGMPPR